MHVTHRHSTTAAVYLTLALAGGAATAEPVVAPPAGARPASLEPPAVVEQHQPEYPAAALAHRLTGDVGVTVTIDAAGTVTGTELSRGVASELDRAAMEAASRWRFRPAQRDGAAIPSRVQLVFHFEPPAAAPAEIGRAHV